MVTGDHNRFDIRFTANGNRFLCLRSRWINHAHKSHKGKVFFHLICGGIFRHTFNHLIGNRQNTQCIFAHCFRNFSCGFNISGHTTGCHHIKGTFYNHHVLTVDPIDGRHQLAIGIKGNLRQTRIFSIQFLLWHAILMGRQNNSRFRGIANMLLFIFTEHNRTVTAKSAIHEKFSNCFRAVFSKTLCYPFTIHIGRSQCHSVLGQRTGFIRTDHRCST